MMYPDLAKYEPREESPVPGSVVNVFEVREAVGKSPLAYFRTMKSAKQFAVDKGEWSGDGIVVTRWAVVTTEGKLVIGNVIDVYENLGDMKRQQAVAKLYSSLSKSEMDLLGIPESARK